MHVHNLHFLSQLDEAVLDSLSDTNQLACNNNNNNACCFKISGYHSDCLQILTFLKILSFFFSFLNSASLSQQLLGTGVTSSARCAFCSPDRLRNENEVTIAFCIIFLIRGLEQTLKYSNTKVICLFRNAAKCLHICLHSPVLHLISTGTEQLCLVSR